MQHLWVFATGPCRLRQLVHLLERQPGSTLRTAQNQPFLPARVRLTRGRRLVSRAVRQPEEPAVELSQGPGVGAVQDNLVKPGIRVGLVHEVTSVDHYASG
jgi:hypothetical protein